MMLEPDAILQLSLLNYSLIQQSGLGVLAGFADLIGGVIPLVIGILVIVLIVGAAIILLPAILVGLIIWFLTGSFFYAGIAFLLVAAISLVKLI